MIPNVNRVRYTLSGEELARERRRAGQGAYRALPGAYKRPPPLDLNRIIEEKSRQCVRRKLDCDKCGGEVYSKTGREKARCKQCVFLHGSLDKVYTADLVEEYRRLVRPIAEGGGGMTIRALAKREGVGVSRMSRLISGKPSKKYIPKSRRGQ